MSDFSPYSSIYNFRHRTFSHPPTATLSSSTTSADIEAPDRLSMEFCDRLGSFKNLLPNVSLSREAVARVTVPKNQGWFGQEKHEGTYVDAVRGFWHCEITGNVYEGEFDVKGDGIPNGNGLFEWVKEGREYEGEWTEGEIEGQGVEGWGAGNKYAGQFCRGRPNRFGIFTFSSGERYLGVCRNGIAEGVGVYEFCDGSVYRGEFAGGFMQGLGYFSLSNGDRYCGCICANKPSGHGIYITVDGNHYDGAWLGGVFHGYGFLKQKNSCTIHGEWHNGILKAGVASDENVFKAAKLAESAGYKACTLRFGEADITNAYVGAHRSAKMAHHTVVIMKFPLYNALDPKLD